MRPPATVKPTTASSRPAGPTRAPARAVDHAPARASGASGVPRASTCARDRLGADDRRPRAPAAGPGSTRNTTSGIEHRDERRRSRRRARRRGRRRRRARCSREVGVRRRRRAAHASPGAAGQLARRRRRAPDDRRDLVERHAEHVVQHEREPLGRASASRARRAAPARPSRRCSASLLRVAASSSVTIGSGSQMPTESSRRARRRAQHVEADAADDRRQPPAEVRRPRGVGAAQPQPRLLHGVLGLGDRAEHPVGDRPQLRAVLLELLGQPVAIVTSHPSVGIRHPIDDPHAADVTGRRRDRARKRGPRRRPSPSRSTTSARPTRAASRPSAASTSTSPPARCSACSARTAPASRRRSAC